MYKYVINRLVIAVPTIIGITMLIFLAMRVLPGDPLQMIFTEEAGTYVLSEEELAKARASLGLDKPLYIQYLAWMKDVIRGELGHSFWTHEPIMALIVRRGPISAQIAVMTLIFSWVIGIPLGMISAMWRNTIMDHLSRLGITVFIAVPSYWLGMLTVLVTVLVFSWRPPLTIIQFWDDPVGNLSITVLPSLAMGTGLAA